MASKPKYYLETTVLLDLIELDPSAPICQAMASIFEMADKKECELITSALTITEVLFAESEKKQGKPDPAIAQKLEAFWHPENSPIEIIPAHELIARKSLQYFREHWDKDGWSKSKGLDLIHLVTAQREKVEKFLTTEGAMKKWAPVMMYSVCRPEDVVAEKTKSSGPTAGGLFK